MLDDVVGVREEEASGAARGLRAAVSDGLLDVLVERLGVAQRSDRARHVVEHIGEGGLDQEFEGHQELVAGRAQDSQMEAHVRFDAVLEGRRRPHVAAGVR